jgi:protein involved in polysaccharide export with SLBB domain
MKRVLLLIAALLLAGSVSERAWAQALSDYKITPNDIIVIDVFGERDLSKEFRVSATGTINYYFLGEVKVAGKTTAEIREALTEELNRDYLVDPQVTVDVKEYRVREVFVNGQVNKPGAILITGEQELDLLSAIAKAGGFTLRANQNKITFTRPGEKERVFSFDDLKNSKTKIPMLPGDIIEVADRKF